MREDNIFKLQKIKLRNFKSISEAEFRMPCNISTDNFRKCKDLLAICGQNGSGKSAVIDALNLLKNMVCSTYNKKIFVNEYMIRHGQEEAELDFEFSLITTDGKTYYIKYEIEIMRKSDKHNGAYHFGAQAYVSQERFYYKEIDKFGRGKYNKCFNKTKNEKLQMLCDSNLSPEGNCDNRGLEIKSGAEKCMSYSYAMGKSYLFVYMAKLDELGLLNDSKIDLQIINEFAKHIKRNLIVLKEQPTVFNNKLYMKLPMLIKNNEIAMCDVEPQETDDLSIGEIDKEKLERQIRPVNEVLKCIMEDTTIGIKECDELFETSSEEEKVLCTIRNGYYTPIKYESNGARKQISIAFALNELLHNPNALVVIDDFDNDLSEYLLKDLLKVLDENIKEGAWDVGIQGQFVFVANNYSVLEVLRPQNVVFTTRTYEDDKEYNGNRLFLVNEERLNGNFGKISYQHISNVKRSNNFRDVYYDKIHESREIEEKSYYKHTAVWKLANLVWF